MNTSTPDGGPPKAPDWRDGFADAPPHEIPHAPQMAVAGNGEGQVPGQTRDEPCADDGAAQGVEELPPIDVTLEPDTKKPDGCTCDQDNGIPWHDAQDCPYRSCLEPDISPVPVKTRADLLRDCAELVESLRLSNDHNITLGNKHAELLRAAESIERVWPDTIYGHQRYAITVQGSQILALRSAIDAAK